MLGYDVCEAEFDWLFVIVEERCALGRNSTSASNEMKSALWQKVVNGRPGTACGVAQELGGQYALIFSGSEARYAETRDLDLTQCGYLRADMLLAPTGWDTTNPRCATNYGGAVDVQYSIDGGANWLQFQHFEPTIWRSEKFFSMQWEVSGYACTAATRFRFNQPTFQASLDYWALDNVRVLRKLPGDWRSSAQALEHKREGKQGMQMAQCCFDTDWCEHRLSAAEMEDCKVYPWFEQDKYLMRDEELILLLVALIAVVKFLYVSVQDYLILHRYPFQSEWEEFLDTYLSVLYPLLPPRYRPRRNINKYLTNIHALARMDVAMREHLGEEEGQGKRQKRKEEIKADKESKREKKMKTRNKHLEKRNKLASMKSNKYAADHIAELDRVVEEHDEHIRNLEVEEKEPEADLEQFGKDALIDDVERLKRQNLATMRTPFEIRASLTWIYFFVATTFGSMVVLFLYQVSTCKYYYVYENFTPFDVTKKSVLLNSYVFNVLALLCDFKEIFFCCKYVVPVLKRWRQKVTLDRTADVMSLFIDNHSIPLQFIESVQLFSQSFAVLCGLGYLVAAMPWCLISLILRNQFLTFDTMRVVTPMLGGLMVARALTGPALFVKMAFTFYYLAAYNMFTRERIGVGCQAPKTLNTAINFAVAFAFIGGIFTALVAFSWFIYMILLSFVFGFLYGVLAGWVHSIPVRPWFHLTTLDGGLYLIVKKKQLCPCVYWGLYCTDMHQFCEVLLLYTEDDVKFINSLKGGGDVVM
jgi:hypothetical protein